MISRLILCSFMFFAAGLFSQDSLSLKKSKNIPLLSVKAAYGSVVRFGEYVLIFDKIIEDSRCPSDVECIRAGSVTIGIGIFKKGKLLGNRTITFPNGTPAPTLLNTDKILVSAVAVAPYPKVGRGALKKTDYILEIKAGYR